MNELIILTGQAMRTEVDFKSLYNSTFKKIMYVN